MHYSWPSLASFDLWHNSLCISLGIPYPNRNMATGEVDDDAQWTTAYTEVIEVDIDDWRAYVEPDIAAAYPDGLGQPSDPPPSKNEFDIFQ